SLDIYVNETTCHADVILPALSPLEHSHYDLGFTQLAIRNYANWSEPVVEPPEGMPDEWETLVRLTALVSGAGPNADVDAVDDMVAAERARREGVELEPSNKWHGPERLLDIMLRGGPYELTMDDLVAAPHGIDLGPLEPRLPDVARTPSGLVEMAPAA